MKRFTTEEISKIEAINGTLSDRYEYMEAITEIIDARSGTVRWNVNHMKTISLPDNCLLDISTKTAKGKRFVVDMRIYNERGSLVLCLERKKGVWCNTFDREWFTPEGQYREGAEELQNKAYIG